MTPAPYTGRKQARIMREFQRTRSVKDAKYVSADWTFERVATLLVNRCERCVWDGFCPMLKGGKCEFKPV